jgi:hypothetical protein
VAENILSVSKTNRRPGCGLEKNIGGVLARVRAYEAKLQPLA